MDEDEIDVKDGQTPPGDAPGKEPVAEPKLVPLAAVQEERQKRKALADQLAEAQRTIEAIRKQTPANPPAANPSTDLDAIKNDLASLRAEQRQRQLANALGLTEQQAEAVAKTMDALPGLNSQEALEIAKGRNADLFKGQQESGMTPGQRASLRPTPGARLEPPKNDWDQRKTKLKELQKTDSIAADELRNNMIGSLAAKALGIPHRPLPI